MGANYIAMVCFVLGIALIYTPMLLRWKPKWQNVGVYVGFACLIAAVIIAPSGRIIPHASVPDETPATAPLSPEPGH